MNCKAMAAGIFVAVSGLFVLSGQPPAASGIFTQAQAEAGRVAFENTCGKCHTSSLKGRKGLAGEMPPVSSLSAAYQEFIGPRGYVSPLAGPEFVSRWGGKTAAQLIARFQETVGAFPPEGMTEETTVNITAYVLQVNGAVAGTRPLARNTAVVVGTVMR